MGNQLAGIAPSQILSVESYFSDIHDLEYDKSLGSTRFFKVAPVKHREGPVVVKVFAIQDPTLPLTSYKQELEELKIRLHSAQNCLPFQKAAEKASEKAAMLFRHIYYITVASDDDCEPLKGYGIFKIFFSKMIHREPDKRLEAEDYLKQQCGNAFPEIFYTFLQPYMAQFAKETFLSADECILVIRKDLDNIIHNLCGHDLLEKADGEPKENGCNDSVPRVRAEALRTLTKVLALVKEVPRNDVNIYPEYILPGIAHLAQDDATVVRLACAENIALLAETALRSLELVQLKNLNVENDPNSEEIDEVTHPSGNYDTELQALHEMVQQKVVTLLSDPENIVKQTLMENGITRLCVFFGRQKANDVLLSHMITFLKIKMIGICVELFLIV
ncbi:hypothetical protein MJT46_000039 [Ovis ammon polii x Ovis aries]|nr:hypothetical protein MJT46_000039 [Ovis ammon polii x Ovis aries]